ncbi:MAG: hypothetical protein D6784_14270 [Chloroflexi bacterium]|nr:MAG: hypothetical protein D6784_14270 [Chloroflexota bacterium]
MKTPAGKECKFYYADFHRGRNVQECRLIARNLDSPPWRPALCRVCPVPDILRANQSESMKLEATVEKQFFGLRQVVKVTGWCSECFSEIPDPMVGCPNCGPSARPSILNLDEGPE